MKKVISVIILFLCLVASVNAQTKTKNDVLLNSAGNSITIGSPVTVTNNTILFPGTLGLQGGLLYISSVAGSIGTTTWLNPGTNGFILSLSGGLPIWSDPAVLLAGSYWSLAGNAPAAAYNGTTGSFLGTTNTQPLVLATTNTTTAQPIEFFTNNVEQARIASTGQLLLGTTTPQATVTVNGETYSNTFLTQVNTSKPAWQEGRFFYDTSEKTIAYYNDHNGVTLNLGQEEWIRVYNASGASIANGSAVYINGDDAGTGLPTIALSQANVLTTAEGAAIATETIPNNSFGYVTEYGVIHNLNTSAYAPGAPLYVSATTAGALTSTRPSQPNFATQIGWVATVDAVKGKILVIPTKARFGAYTTGAIAFGGTDGNIKENPTGLFFDSTNVRLGIGTNTPGQTVEAKNGNILLSNNNATAGGLKFQGTSTGITTIQAGAQGATALTYTLPTVAPTVGQVLSSTAAGAMSWVTKSGTVTSVALSLTGGLYTVSGSPITTSGTLTGTMATQAANLVFAGPLTGAAAVPTFRSLVAADISGIGWSLSGNSPASSYNGTTGSFLGTTNTQPLVLATTNTVTPQPIQLFTNNVERARIASTGQFLVGTTTPLATVTVNGETYSNTFLPQINVANPAYAEGRIFYDSAEHALSYYNEATAEPISIGQENLIRVKNVSGATIVNGSAVYINGDDVGSGLPTVALAKADQLATADAIGLTENAIPNNTIGYISSFGVVDNFNTSGFAPGATLYISATTAGALTNIRPNQPNLTNPIGYVEFVGVSGGVIVIAGKTRQGAMTKGAIAFGGTDGFIKENPTGLFFDSSNVRLGIGTNTPAQTLEAKNGNILLSNSTTTAGQLQFQGTSTGISTFQAGAQGATNLNYTLPIAAPTAGQILSSTAGGVLSWSGVGATGWALSGNTGIAGTNFLGTTDANDLVVKTNNLYRMSVVGGATNTGNVGIGTTTATTTTVAAAIGDKLTILGGDLSFNSESNSAITRSILFRGTAGSGNFRIGADGGDIFWQGGGGQNLQMGCYWRIDLLAQRQTAGFPAFSAQATDCHIFAPLAQPTIPGIILRGAASQSADLMQWQNSGSTILSSVSAGGEIYSNTFRANITSGYPAYAEGRIFYDTSEHALTYFNEDASDRVKIGQEEVIRVRNMSGAAIPAGSAVYINGADAATGLSTIALAKADQLATSDAIGLSQSAIASNSIGYIVSFGTIDNLNTVGYTAGATLFLSATTAGAVTPTRPGQPNFTYPIAFVENVGVLGSVLVRAGNLRQGAMTPGAVAFGGSDGYIAESPAKLFFDSVNQRLGIGTNAPGTAIDLSGDISIRYHGITLSADSVDNLAVGAFSYVGITGRTNNYFITGISGGTDGKQIQLINLTPKSMTLYHQNAGSTSSNRIYNPSGQNISIADSGTVGLVYNGLLNCWVVQSSVSAMTGTGNFTIVRQKSDQSITNSTTFKTATDLNYNTKPNSIYEIELVVFDSGVGGSYLSGIASVPTGSTLTGEVSTYVNGHLAPDVDIIRNGNFSSGGGSNTMSGVSGYSMTHAILTTGSTGGVVTFTWGMLSSGIGKTVWLFKDSYSIVRLIGKV